MNTLQKSFKEILSQTGNENEFNLDLLESTEFNECSEYYCNFLKENRAITITNSEKTLDIFSKFSTGENFKSVIKKLDDNNYTVHRTINGNKVLVFIDNFLSANAYCEFHFKENVLIFAKIIIDSKEFKTQFKQEFLSSTDILQNVNEERYILEDLKSNKLYVSLNGSTKLVYFDESALCNHIENKNKRVV